MENFDIWIIIDFKKLELALPDIPITAKQAEVISSFIKKYDISIVIVKG